MGYFSKEERNKRRNAPEIEKFEEKARELKENFEKASKEKGFGDSMLEWDCKRNIVFCRRLCKGYEDKKEFETLMKRSYEGLYEVFADSMKLLDEYAPIIIRNKEENEKLFKNGVPLFITLVPVNQKCFSTRFAFCYEFKKTEEEGKYIANVLFSKNAAPFNEEINSNDYLIREMTREEFEQHYIMDRLNRMSDGLRTEEEIVKFDNSIRQLFNGQD